MKGEVVYFYAFDVANEIAISKVHEILANRPVPFEINTDHTIPKDIPLYKPISIELPSLNVLENGQPIRTLVHVYEIGVISIMLRIVFEKKDFGDLIHYHKPTLNNGKTLNQVAKDICQQAFDSLKQVLLQPNTISEPEAYTSFCITDIGSKTDLSDWISKKRERITELLTENKPGVLNDMQVNEVMRLQRAYSSTDVTIIDWDAAFVVDLSGYVEDVLYVLELANLQLEEYLVLDKRLDNYLNKSYDDIKYNRIRPGTSTKILRKLRTLRVDVTKLNDEVTNITKFSGDWYLARLYLCAKERFHLNQWRNSVETKIKQLDDVYTVIQNEINNLRMVSLEIIIVVFFAIDLLLRFIK